MFYGDKNKQERLHNYVTKKWRFSEAFWPKNCDIRLEGTTSTISIAATATITVKMHQFVYVEAPQDMQSFMYESGCAKHAKERSCGVLRLTF